MTFGYVDELEAATEALAGRGTYEQTFAAQKARNAHRGFRALANPVSAAEANIVRALQRDEITPQKAQGLARALGSDRPIATLADVGDENVKGLLERVAQTPGAGRVGVSEFLTKRQQQQMNRIAIDLSELTGTQQSAFEAVNETSRRRYCLRLEDIAAFARCNGRARSTRV